MNQHLAIIGFGEAGETFARAARWESAVSAYDIDRARRGAMTETGAVAAVDPAHALAQASIVLSLVTADQALAAAADCADVLPRGALWCDMNSVAPDTKRAAAAAIERAGGHYVDVAVLAPVNPARLDVPLLMSGRAAMSAADALVRLGFTNVRVVGTEVGRASAIKMIRSVMVKGIEALTDEMMAAAAAAGVADEVLASLDASERHDPWPVRAGYNLERMATHGARRAAEMEEAARTLAALGVEPVMTNGTVRRQREAATIASSNRNAA